MSVGASPKTFGSVGDGPARAASADFVRPPSLFGGGIAADDPGVRSGKQPFIFHIAQDLFSAAVNFLFQFMI